MNPLYQTLIRSVLKTAGGYFVAKGFADESTIEVIVAGLVALVGVVWGIKHRAPAAASSAGKIGLLALLLCPLLTGCAFVHVHDPQTGNTVINATIPAWPWQDTASTLNKLTVSSATNRFNTSLSGMGLQGETSTNAVALMQAGISAGVDAAIKALAPIPK